ncbi:MAG TPA: hypothetical protein VKR99_00380 [Candidatus Eremiobacteraceae bacterium]|nr:hypothetical protein [Candidatus Eremiobacteraceae bacterium]
MTGPSLLDVCKQFEALLLRSLWPLPDSTAVPLMEGSDDASGALFREAFGLALESAGGFGAARQLAHHLARAPG